jgi:hypothetical protein
VQLSQYLQETPATIVGAVLDAIQTPELLSQAISQKVRWIVDSILALKFLGKGIKAIDTKCVRHPYVCVSSVRVNGRVPYTLYLNPKINPKS